MMSPVKWENVDYRECARYVALNWDEYTCNKSKLRRILPHRRSRQGSRPSVKGKNPRGKESGDTEQWIFPSVMLEEWEKKLLVATVVEIATCAMFQKHFYNFGGATYHQKEGGPIGLRGTCAVARLTMQLFDVKWRELIERWRLAIWLVMRYMDDKRIFLPPIRKGWRCTVNGLEYCQRWEEEDRYLSDTQVTKEVLL